MNIAALWDQLVGAVCRPPRDIYEESDLVGGTRSAFAFGESRSRIKKYYRQDIQLINNRNQKLQCSHYRPCVVTSSDGRLPCVVYCHTNSGSRRDAEEILFTLLPKGITVFALDFSGSGRSDGEWVTLGAHEVDDLATAVQYIREEGSTSTLALWGRSMGAVTALLYSHRDPSIAGVVVDSPFSRLTDLMLELATDSQSGLNVPRPLVKVALTMMRRSVRKKAGFDIDDVAPLDLANEMYVPALFGHAEEDSFIPAHHSERLFEAHGADTKNFINFDGDHNGARPEFWYDSGLIFLLSVLRVEELVGPDIDLHSVDLEQAPHMRGAGIYVAGSGTTSNENDGDGGVDDEVEGEARAVLIGTGRTRTVAAPWDISNSRISSAVVEQQHHPRQNSSNSKKPLRGILKGGTTGAGAEKITFGTGTVAGLESVGAGSGRNTSSNLVDRNMPTSQRSSINSSSRRESIGGSGGGGGGGGVGHTTTSSLGNVSDYNEYEDDDEEDIVFENDDEESEEAILQRVIELSLAESHAGSMTSSSPPGAVAGVAGVGGGGGLSGVGERKRTATDVAVLPSSLPSATAAHVFSQNESFQDQEQGQQGSSQEEREVYDEEAALAAAIAESLKFSSADPYNTTAPAAVDDLHMPAMPAEVTFTVAPHGGGVDQTLNHTSQTAAREHSKREADAVHEAVDYVHHELENLIDIEGDGSKKEVALQESNQPKAEESPPPLNVDKNEPIEDSNEDFLERLRAESAKFAGNI